jgi:hypothetical protein
MPETQMVQPDYNAHIFFIFKARHLKKGQTLEKVSLF